MMTAMLTAKNILAGERKYDVWAVNQDAEYHEAGAAGEEAAEAVSHVPVRNGFYSRLSKSTLKEGISRHEQCP